jgi:TRAP-type uncharacterized transport system substrate-binding protein
MLEAASELVGSDSWRAKQARISLRIQGDDSVTVCLYASDAPGAVDEVVRGAVQIAIVNPSAVLSMAYRGLAPFSQPAPVRTISVIHQFDQMGFAVRADSGLRSLRDVRERKYPLRLSLRGQTDHSVHLVVNTVLSVLGFTLEDIVAWGGQVRYDQELPYGPNRLGAVQRGEIDAIFDEAMPAFGNEALEAGMRFLGLEEAELQALEARGLRRVPITKDEFPLLHEDIWSMDFSGWPIFCRADLSDEVVTAFCGALEARKDRIPWYGDGPLNLDQMCRDTRDGPLMVLLHPAAERFWKERGYLL